MPIQPDYGLRLREQGLGDVTQHFYAVSLDHITILDPGSGFTTLVNLEHDGRAYAASFDLPDALWEALNEALPPEVSDEVDSALKRIDSVPYTIELSRPVRVDIQARLGTPQRGVHDTFVPLIVERIAG